MNKQAQKLYQSGQKQAAVKFLARKLQTDFGYLSWFIQLAGYLVAGGDLIQAEELLIKAKQLFPDAQAIDYNLAVVYFQAGQWEKVVELLKSINDPALLSDAYYLLAKTSQKQQQIQQALVFALTAIDYDSRLNDNFLLAGDLLLQLQDFSEAQGYYQNAIKLQPSAAGYFKLGLCEMVTGDLTFQDHFQKARQLDESYVNQHQQQLAEIERYVQMMKEKENPDE
ncbi:tetratricopeptide repeat protein [Bombilactobacillus folatiphilus]|uniref:Tetratricopeptide repeat protein n=1 Tax=Bombilactobacillus folatiphilus TaxID=2923362 RepID=A0ABY4PAR9_9LACO|nr:tetratricopeptide repeat protein [Bombilactobacillus folatiphilus]UQS82720.1 tetratricopeptide repeat protein [Bombilactobacillus folatiphilus]